MTSLVALRDRREQVIALLGERFSTDVLDVHEYELRVDRANAAKSMAELEAIIADLEPPATTSTALVKRASSTLATDRRASRWSVGIIGGVERKGSWTPAESNKVLAVMGGAILDFRDAILPAGPTDIKAFALMGGVQIIVPPGMHVECDGVGIMGGFSGGGPTVPERNENEPYLRVSGLAMMGGVDIETRLPGESVRDMRKRLKQERRARAKGQ